MVKAILFLLIGVACALVCGWVWRQMMAEPFGGDVFSFARFFVLVVSGLGAVIYGMCGIMEGAAAIRDW